MSERDDDASWNKIQQAIGELPRELEPGNDQWNKIERRIQLEPNTKHGVNNRWMPFAVAASLLIAVFSSLLSVKTMHDYDAFKQQHRNFVAQQEQLQLMEQERQLIRANFMSQFSELSPQMQPELVADIRNNLAVIEQAILDIRKAMVKQPGNERLEELLQETYRSEKVLINNIEQNYPDFRGEV